MEAESTMECNVCLNKFKYYELQNPRFCCSVRLCSECYWETDICPQCRSYGAVDNIISDLEQDKELLKEENEVLKDNNSLLKDNNRLLKENLERQEETIRLLKDRMKIMSEMLVSYASKDE